MKHYKNIIITALTFPFIFTACSLISRSSSIHNKDLLTENTTPSNSNISTSQLFRYDGYMKFQTEEASLTSPTESLNLSYSIAPASFETIFTGIVSEYSPHDNAGYDLSMGKYKTIAFRFGDGTKIFTMQTGVNVIHKNEWNTVQVDFRGDLGTVKITVNGKIEKEEQIAKGTKIIPAQVDKRIGCNYDKDIVGGGVMIRNVFDGYITEENVKGKVVFLPSKDLKEEINHPVFHAEPSEKWMNEPHGPFFYKGKYHLFYQSNAHGPYFNNLCWGHWVSDDLINWKNLETALDPEFGTVSPDGCWSGSSIISPDGTPLIFYTAGDDGKSPTQMVAVARPDNLNDPNLTTWTEDKKPIITQQKDVMLANEFRDPFVFEEDGKYWCLVGTGDKATQAGNAGVYLAKDNTLSDWEFKGFLMDYEYIPMVGHDWELPVLLPIKGGGDDITHILTVCACRIDSSDPVKTYYWLGKFDSTTGKFIPKDITPRAIDDNALSIGGTGFVTPDKRTVLFLISQGKRSSDADGVAGYAHCASIPLDLRVNNGELCIKPIDEVKNLRKETVFEQNDVTPDDLNKALLNVQYGEIEINMELPNDDFTLFLGKKTLSYYKNDKEFGFVGDYGKSASVNVNGDTVNLRIIIDRSLVECFLNEQSYCATRVYSKGKLARDISIMTNSIIKHIVIFKL